MAIDWPEILGPQDVNFYPENQSRSGGEGLSGVEQVIDSGAGRWRAEISVPITSDAKLLAARAFVTRLRGRAETVLVPAFDARRASWPVDTITGRVLHPGNTRDKSLDGTAYESAAIPDISAVTATANAAAALRAVSIAINVTQGEALIAGQYFGAGSRLYLIDRITSLAGTINTVGFWPPLRAAVSSGATILLTRPVCEMRLATDDAGALNVRLLRHGMLTLEFTEAF